MEERRKGIKRERETNEQTTRPNVMGKRSYLFKQKEGQNNVSGKERREGIQKQRLRLISGNKEYRAFRKHNAHCMRANSFPAPAVYVATIIRAGHGDLLN
jgi:hypothetical protein